MIARGYEPCTLAEVKAYRPATTSLTSGQVLLYPYTFDKARLVVKEMTDALVLDLVDKKKVVHQQVDLFTDYTALEQQKEQESQEEAKEKKKT